MLINWNHRQLWKPDEPPAGTAPAGEPAPATPPAAPLAPVAVQGPDPSKPAPGQEPAPKPEPESSGDDLEELIKTNPAKAAKEIKKLRAEAKKRADDLKILQDKQKAADDAALAEQGKFKELAETRAKDIDALKEAHQKERMGWVVQIAAIRMGFHDPEDANVDDVLNKVKVSKDGEFEGIDEALKAYATKKPHLIKQEAPPSGTPKINATNPGGGPTMTAIDLKKLRPEQIASMSEEEVAAILSRGQ